MAWYEGKYSCGHEGRVNIIGPEKDRTRKIQWHFSGLCPECREKQRQTERENIAAQSRAAELPELTGTEKQIAWANKLRLEAINDLWSRIEKIEEALKTKGLDKIPNENFGIAEISDAVQDFIMTHTSSKFWIESRYDKLNIGEITKEYVANAEAKQPENMEESEEPLTVIPDTDDKRLGVAVVSFDGSVIFAKYLKDDKFREIVKELGYKWSGMVWEKKITEYTGSAAERAAEIGNKLLLNGFTVQFPDQESKNKAISANFVPENDRWVKFNSKTRQLVIAWVKRSDTLYENVKKLPGAKWSNGSIKVNIEFYREVHDFAETMGFSISKRAQEEIEKYKQKESGFEKADISIHAEENISDRERIEKSLKSDGTIIEDLRDDT